jgi:hypothetical protein
MNMLDMIGSAQSGRAVDNLGQQFGLSDKQAAAAIQALLPALSSGLKRNTATPEGLAALLGALNRGDHARYYDDQKMFSESVVRDDGDRILGHVMGSKQVSRAAVERASEQTGIGAGILKQMLPYIAALVMSALAKEGRNPLNDILGEMLGGGGKSGDPFGPLADVIMGGGEAKSSKQGTPSAIDIFGSMLDADGDGSAMDDIFEMITKASR